MVMEEAKGGSDGNKSYTWLYVTMSRGLARCVELTDLDGSEISRRATR
jgi:hypothetical protein